VDVYEHENEYGICGSYIGDAKDLGVVGFQTIHWKLMNCDLYKGRQLFTSWHSVISQETSIFRDNESFSYVKGGYIFNLMSDILPLNYTALR